MTFKPVNTDINIICGPIISDVDFKSRMMALTSADIQLLNIIVEKADDQIIVNNTLTLNATGWQHVANGYYKLAIPAVSNDNTGILHGVGYAPGALPFRSMVYSVLPTGVYQDFTDTGVLTWLRNMIVPIGPVWQYSATALANSSFGTIQVIPLTTTVGVGDVSSYDWVAFQYSGFVFGPMVITDQVGAPVSMAGHDVHWVVYKQDNETVDFELSGVNIIISGLSNNQITITSSDTNTQTARDLKWVLRDQTNDFVIAKGTLSIKKVPDIL